MNGPRYTLDVIARLGDTPAAAPAPALNGNSDHAGRTLKELFQGQRRLTAIAKRADSVNVHFDRGDGSRWDHLLCCEAFERVENVTPGEVGTMLAHARSLHPDGKDKHERPDYIARTVERARQAVERNKALKEGPPATAPATEVWRWASQHWNATDDPVIGGRAVGVDDGAIVYVTRASGTERRLMRIGDLYDRDFHVRRVGAVLGCVCPRFDADTAYQLAQKLRLALGIDARDETAEFARRLEEFETDIGDQVTGEPTEWWTLKKAVDWRSSGREDEARAWCGIRDSNGDLWLPAGGLCKALGMNGDELAAEMDNIGWRAKRVDKRAPVNDRPPGTSEKQGRHIVRVFYAAPSSEPPMPPMSDTRAPVPLTTEGEVDVNSSLARTRHGGHGGHRRTFAEVWKAAGQ